MTLSAAELKAFLDQKADYYNHLRFVESDPIGVPHRFSRKEDIEIAAWFASTIAWGSRKTVIANAEKMMALMDDAPFDFVMRHDRGDLRRLSSFAHRTFNGQDLQYAVAALRRLYRVHGGLERSFAQCLDATGDLQAAIGGVRAALFETPPPARSRKHFPNPLSGSAAKRVNLFLRWMVRRDAVGVDFGLWRSISPSQLSCPLDVHSGRVARTLGLLKRKQNDQKAVAELDEALRKLDPQDPVKYDFALFGLGVFERFC